MGEISFIVFFDEESSPIIFDDERSIFELKDLLCNFFQFEFNNFNIYLESYGQIDNEDMLDLPLNVLELEPKNKKVYSLFIYLKNKKEKINKIFCSQKIIPFTPLKQVGFKLNNNKSCICLTCSIYCRKGEFSFDDVIINEEFICKCSLLNDNKCKFCNFNMEENTELKFKTIYSLLKNHSEALIKYEINKKKLENEKILSRNFNFEKSINFCRERIFHYKDEKLKEKILEIIPRKESNIPDSKYIKELLHWFKKNFFSWCNKPKCPKCNLCENNIISSQIENKPTKEEEKNLAYRVEIYKCEKCKYDNIRFPRYNNPLKLLETKTGRCGEWANLFGCILNACGYKTRFIDNFEDHVWNEYYNEEEKRWIHIDSCEEAYDQPLLYEQGWGRIMTYILAFSIDEVKDVTPRYVKNWNDVIERRNKNCENELHSLLYAINTSIQSNLNHSDLINLEQRNCLENQELENLKSNCDKDVCEEEMKGRQSGSVEWRKQRGEI